MQGHRDLRKQKLLCQLAHKCVGIWREFGLFDVTNSKTRSVSPDKHSRERTFVGDFIKENKNNNNKTFGQLPTILFVTIDIIIDTTAHCLVMSV